jgi:hypothetical protein
LRKLLHLAFAIWKSGRPFDPHHYPWPMAAGAGAGDADPPIEDGLSGNKPPAGGQAAGHRPDSKPARQVVTAACAHSVAGEGLAGDGSYIDFAHLKRQLPLARVLDQLGLSDRLRGRGAQRRGACPLHRGDARGRTFSVNLDENVFHCFDKQCGRKGDVIDFWAAAHGYTLREAALDLVRTFGLEPAPQAGTEQRNG